MRTLLINPPPVNGIAFTRQGRCQEREEVLGTTKPPYSLLVCAALFRERSLPFRLIDQTAAKLSTPAVIAQLDAEGFRPELIVFPSTTPTLDADVDGDGAAEGALRRRAGVRSDRTPRRCRRSRWRGRPQVDAMIVGEPEDAIVALASGAAFDAGAAGVGAGVTWRAPGGARSSRTPPRARSPAS